MTAKELDILLVDDNSSDVELMDLALKRSPMPFILNVCEDGEQAIQYLRGLGPYRNARRPDIVLLDLNLPKKNGEEVLKEIRSDGLLESIPVAVFSTSGGEADIQRAAAYPKTRFFMKPFQFKEYTTILKSIQEFWLSTQ